MTNQGIEERVANIEGMLSQMDRRLNHLETEISELRNDIKTKADKWEIRIWFFIILLLLTIYRFFNLEFLYSIQWFSSATP
jgi:hypothetical protein